jgi:cold shock CspA family protein
MSTGTVKWFNGPSGYGVITDDAEGRELFVHRGSLTAAGTTLYACDRVAFEFHEAEGCPGDRHRPDRGRTAPSDRRRKSPGRVRLRVAGRVIVSGTGRGGRSCPSKRRWG